MTESLYFEANEEKAMDLAALASRLGASSDDLLNEALDLLLAAHRHKASGGEAIGVLAVLHGLMSRLRTVIEELDYIRFTTCGADSMLAEFGVTGQAYEAACGHYEKIFQSAERALAAAGYGPMLVSAAIEPEQ